AVGDVKYVWELNRLQFLPAMAALARSRGHTKAYDYCLACIESWIDANPPFKGINWVSGIELAIRSVNLMLTVSLIGAEQIPPTIARKIRTALNTHAIWLARFPSRFSSANNHLIAEAGALFILGTAMPDLPGAARYRAYGHATLVREAGKQILDDGVGAEQSPTYTGFTLEWYLLALSVARADGKTFPASVTERLHGAGIHLRWITDGAGNQPRIGDDDEGRVICCGPERQRHYVSGILSGLAVATGDPALAPPALHPHLRDAFLGAAPDHSAGPEGRRVFDTGGYTVFRRQLAGRQAMLVFDHGPLGYLPIAAHGHADALSVWLHLDGQPVLIDAGTYLYHSGGAMRDYFRGTRAHNTLTLDDQDQSRISAAFIWSRKAKCWRLPEPDAGGDRCVAGQHDGYLKRFGLLHQRRVCFGEPDAITIIDKLIGVPKSPDLTAQIRYHIAPYIDVTHREANQLDLAIDGALIATITLNMGSGGAPCPVRLVTSKISQHFGVISDGQCILSELSASDLLTAELNVRLCFKN
ncbi:MAG: alginate lyase family protein, partial [Hyphomicrobiales bacterium]